MSLFLDRREICRPIYPGVAFAGERTTETNNSDGGEAIAVFFDHGIDEVLNWV